jgi:homoserine O-succinyltransferase
MSILRKASRPVLRAIPKSGRRRIEIGLVNNMGDQALKVTERQFGALVAEASDDLDLRFRIFALEGIRRSEPARDYIAARYEPASAIARSELDALIFTGAQPQAERLNQEPYWDELVELIDWAKLNTASTILSCLAAHAGVLHLDGIQRRPLPEKRTGVFAFTSNRTHPLVGKKGEARLIPHSRYNDLVESELEDAGYSVLSSSPAHGVDTFTKCFGSQFVFLQGHPEYDANSLAKEYRRDLELYLRRRTEREPARPMGYFGAGEEAELCAMERRARDDRASVRIEDLSLIDSLPGAASWRDSAASFFRNWVEMIANAVGLSRGQSSAVRTPELASP